ncbi:hypothetical protein [Shewanella algae]|uniref:hypothetical protein n=1 Tax=Shewanella algae TaxID=38313 RepID=UPI0031F4890B
MKKTSENQTLENQGEVREVPVKDAAVSQEWNPEISPELAGMRASEEATPTPQPSAPGKTAEQQAAELAQDLGKIVSGTIESITGRNYGLTEQSLGKWSEGVAPVLVKYGLTDIDAMMGKYGAEIQAAIATFALGAGCYAAHKQYQREDEEKAKAKAEKETEQKEAA